MKHFFSMVQSNAEVAMLLLEFDVIEFLNRRMCDRITRGTITLGNKI
ncbi:hypothetical protein [Sphingobacterium sp.]